MHFNTDQATEFDTYNNGFGGNFDKLPLGVFWGAPSEIQTFAVGDLVFIDRNNDGVYTAGYDYPVSNVLLNLLDENGNPVLDQNGDPIQTRTNGAGRYLFRSLFENNYMIEVDASNFKPFESLECYGFSNIAPGGATTVNDDNEEDDHNASVATAAGGVRSLIVNLNMGTEPMNDDRSGGSLVPAVYPDTSVNLTVDFGFVQEMDCTPSKEKTPEDFEYPSTGYEANVVTRLPEKLSQEEVVYRVGLYVEIPKLGVEQPIYYVPVTKEGWDVSGLGNGVGYLVGTAYPTTSGNSVLSAHNYLPSGLAGPFVDLKTLGYGDIVKIRNNGLVYVYEVNYNQLVSPSYAKLISQDGYDKVTLVTCERWNESKGEYDYRRIVQAVLVKIESGS